MAFPLSLLVLTPRFYAIIFLKFNLGDLAGNAGVAGVIAMLSLTVFAYNTGGVLLGWVGDSLICSLRMLVMTSCLA